VPIGPDANDALSDLLSGAGLLDAHRAPET
jgi:hypothetical protein